MARGSPISAERETLTIGGREVAVSNPPRCCSRRPGTRSSISSATTSRWRTARCARRAAARTCWCAIRTASAASSSIRSARRRRARRGSRSSRSVSVRANRRRGRAARRGRAGLDGEPRVPRAASAPGSGGRSRSSRRAARRSRSGARCHVGPDPGGRASGSSRSGRFRADRLAEDVRLARYARLRPDRARAGRSTEVRRAALALAREVERRAPALATSKWWKEERHGVFLDYNQNAKDRTIAAAYSVRPDAGRARVGAARVGRNRRVRSGDFTLATMPARFAAVGDRHAAIDAQRGVARERCSSCPRGTSAKGWATRRGRRTTGSRRASRRACSRRRRRAPAHPLIEIARARRKEDALAGLERWKARHPEAASHLRPADVLVDAMRGRFATWTRIRLNLQHVPAELRPRQEPLDPDEDMASDWDGISDRDDRPRRRPSRARKAS